jgi:hypothetical protein
MKMRLVVVVLVERFVVDVDAYAIIVLLCTFFVTFDGTPMLRFCRALAFRKPPVGCVAVVKLEPSHLGSGVLSLGACLSTW